MKTVLIPCQVPWSISPSTSGVTLLHCETDYKPECSVVFGGGRMQDTGRTDSRRIEIVFELCYYSRTGHHHDDQSIESLGYEILGLYDGDMREYLNWNRTKWLSSGVCPDSGFYIAKESAWHQSLPEHFQKDSHHYVIDGRDGYVELIAHSFQWREWLWKDCHRDEAIKGPVVGQGEGIS